MLSAICFDLDQSKILSSGNGLTIIKTMARGERRMNPVAMTQQSTERN